MAETALARSTISGRGVTLRLNYRLKGYFSRHCDMTQFTLAHHMVIKQFLLLGLAAEYWIEISVDAINIAADHQMFTTLTGELSWQRLRRSAVDFYSKNENIALWATLSGLSGNIRTPSIARWKARGRLYIRHNWTFFAIFYGWDVVSGNLSKSAFLEGGSVWVQISEGRKRRPPTTAGVRVAEWLPFRVVSK